MVLDKIKHRIHEISLQLSELYEEFDGLDNTHFSRFSEVKKRINELSKELDSLKQSQRMFDHTA